MALETVVSPEFELAGEVDALRRALKASEERAASLQAENDRLHVELADRGSAEAERQRLRTILDTLPAGVSIVGAEGRMVEVNDLFRRIWAGPAADAVPFAGSIPETSVYQGWWAETGEEIRPEEWASSRALLRGETSLGEEVRIRRFDGTFGNILNSAAPLRDETGRITGAVVTLLDVTEARRASEDRERLLAELDARQERLLRLIRLAFDVLAESTGDGLLQKVTDAARALIGARLGAAGHGCGDGLFRLSATSCASEVSSTIAGESFPIRKGGVYLRMVHDGETLRLTEPDLQAHPDWWGLPEGHPPLRGLLGVPLVGRDGHPNGMVMVSDKETGEFTDEDEALLSQLGLIASLGLQHIEARAEVERRAEELGAITDAVPAAILIARDPDCRRLGGNHAAAELLRMPLGSNLSRTAPEGEGPTHFRVFQGDRELAPEELPVQRTAATGVPERGTELRVAFEDGTVRHLYGNTAPLLDEMGRPRGAVAAFLDITERHRIEEGLRQSKERFELLSQTAGRLLMSDAPQQIVETLCRQVMAHLDCHAFFNYLVDPERGCLHLNACAGIPEETARAIEWLESGIAVCGCVARDGCRIVAEDIQHTDDPRADLVRSFGIQAYACHPLLSQGRVIGTLSFGSRSRPSYTEEDLALMKLVTDQVAMAMERIRLYEAAQQRAQEAEAAIAALREADRRKDEFLAMLSHELRNPLAAISGAVQLLDLRRLQEPSLQRAVEAAGRQVRHMARLLDDLLDVARITRGAIELRKERVDLVTTVGHAIQMASPLIQARGHELAITLPADPLCLEADPDRLVQIVANLLTNAAKYTPTGGHIWVSAERHDEGVELRVRDNGHGMPADLLEHVFELFVQGDRALDRAEGGLGIGLTLVRALVEMHGGTVSAHSEGPERGSEFVIFLPSCSEETTAAPAGSAAEVVRTRRVLVVDDNADAAELLGAILEMDGHQVRVANNGPSALTTARAWSPEVVLLDIGMPGMDGLEVARRLRAEPSLARVALVALTGYGQEDDRARTREAGFVHHLTKPVDPADLARVLGALFG